MGRARIAGVLPMGTARCSRKQLSISSLQVPIWPLRGAIMKRRGYPGLIILDRMRSDEAACVLEFLSEKMSEEVALGW